MKWLMKSLEWQQNHHQKILGAWSFVSEGLSPPKPPRGNGTVCQNFSLLFNVIDSEKCLG